MADRLSLLLILSVLLAAWCHCFCFLATTLPVAATASTAPLLLASIYFRSIPQALFGLPFF